VANCMITERARILEVHKPLSNTVPALQERTGTSLANQEA